MVRVGAFFLSFACCLPAFAQDRKPRREPSDLSDIIRQERSSPTTSADVKLRFRAFVEAVMRSGGEEALFPKEEVLRVKSLLDRGDTGEAAAKLHETILAADRAPRRTPPLRRPGIPGERTTPKADRGFPARRTPSSPVQDLVELEKRDPTNRTNVNERIRHAISVAQSAPDGDSLLRLLPPPSYTLERFASGRHDEVARKVREAILSLDARSPAEASSEAGRPSPPGGTPGRAAPASTAGGHGPRKPAESARGSDKRAAAELYYRAMQYYGAGDARAAYEVIKNAARLDPESSEILHAEQRIRKDLSHAAAGDDQPRR